MKFSPESDDHRTDEYGIPEQIGDYKIGPVLGSGGMARVYAAEDTRNNAKRALKVNHRARDLRWLYCSSNTADHSAARTYREAAILSFLEEYSSIPSLHDVGQYRGRIFLVMDLVEGNDLCDHFDLDHNSPAKIRGKVNPSQIKDMIMQTGEALLYMHQRGIVHHDVKPENIMWTPDEQVGVLDFGIAVYHDQSSVTSHQTPSSIPESFLRGLPRSDQRLTPPGGFVGTPAYLAPEAFLKREPSPAVDQFACCATYYHCLYGFPPYGEDGLSKIMQRATEDAVESRVSLPGISTDLINVVLQGIAPKPEDRHQGLDNLLNKLHHVNP